MQTVLGNAQGKPWPVFITLGRQIILLVSMMRLCQKETSSTFAIVNICWKALKHYLIKLCLTMNKPPPLLLFSPNCLYHADKGAFVPPVFVELGLFYLLVMEFLVCFEFWALLVSELFHPVIQRVGDSGVQEIFHSTCVSSAFSVGIARLARKPFTHKKNHAWSGPMQKWHRFFLEKKKHTHQRELR